MPGLAPLQGRILWELEEAGAEDLPTLVFTFMPAEEEADLSELADAIRFLLRIGFVAVELVDATASRHLRVRLPPDEADAFIELLPCMMPWDSTDEGFRWKDRRNTVSVVLTDKGRRSFRQ